MIWRSIPGFSAYEASEDGLVRRAGKTAPLKSAVDAATGYAKLTLYNDEGELKTVSVHRMVCTAFHGSPPEGAQACHRNGVKTRNAASNLYWGSQHQNAADRKAHDGQALGSFLGGLKSVRAVRSAYRDGKISKVSALALISTL
jgi:hypothetical protein